jgi:hypothetical protein
MTRRRLILLAALLTWIYGCASSVPRPSSMIYTLAIFTGEEELLPILTAKAHARECKQPVAAQPGPGFRYGCFCGAGYPDLIHPSGKNDSALHRSERVELAVEYYRIKPIDDIDEACQAHDVCWLMRGDGDARCNHLFRQDLGGILRFDLVQTA